MARERNAPQATAPATNNEARSTRRQNPGVASTAPTPAVRPTSRRGQQAPSAESVDEPPNIRQTRRQAQEPVLSAVAEESPHNQGNARSIKTKAVVPETQAEDDIGPDADNVSTISDNDYDRDLILAGLPQLFASASEVLDTAAPRTLSTNNVDAHVTGLRTSGTKLHKLFNYKVRPFLANRRFCTSAGKGRYIDKRRVSDAILGEQLPVRKFLARKVDEVIHLANLSEFVIWLGIADFQKEDAQTLLQFNESNFPEPFAIGLQPTKSGQPATGGLSGLTQQSFEVLLEFRTQLAIQKFVEGNKPPELILQDIFYIDNDDGTMSLKTWPSGLDQVQASDKTLAKKIYQNALQRVEEIQSVSFLEDSQSVDLDALQERFPWTRCVESALLWARNRHAEIVQSISASGGFDELMEEIENPLKNTRKSFVADPNVQMALEILMDPAVKSATSLPGQARATNYMSARTPADSPPVNCADDDQVEHQLESNDGQQADAGLTGPLKDAQVRLSQLRQQDERNRNRQTQTKSILAGKERKRFVDAQENAQRIEWASQDDAVPSAATKAAVAPKRKRKAAADDVEHNITDDEGFEVDNRKLDANKRRKAAQAYSPADDLSAPSSSKKQRTQEQLDRSSARAQVPGDITRPSQAQIKNRLDAEEAPPPATNYDMEAIRTQAKQNVAAILDRPRQTRIPWSKTEENALFNYIQEHGISWSMIKKIDTGDEIPESGGEHDGPQYLRNRDQVALKDKARNMRFDFLKAGVVIPDNLQRVTLSKMQRDRLASMGIGG